VQNKIRAPQAKKGILFNVQTPTIIAILNRDASNVQVFTLQTNANENKDRLMSDVFCVV
jgi:hypothetical protein